MSGHRYINKEPEYSCIAGSLKSKRPGNYSIKGLSKRTYLVEMLRKGLWKVAGHAAEFRTMGECLCHIRVMEDPGQICKPSKLPGQVRELKARIKTLEKTLKVRRTNHNKVCQILGLSDNSSVVKVLSTIASSKKVPYQGDRIKELKESLSASQADLEEAILGIRPIKMDLNKTRTDLNNALNDNERQKDRITALHSRASDQKTRIRILEELIMKAMHSGKY